jgi:hypothetical protein
LTKTAELAKIIFRAIKNLCPLRKKAATGKNNAVIRVCGPLKKGRRHLQSTLNTILAFSIPGETLKIVAIFRKQNHR